MKNITYYPNVGAPPVEKVIIPNNKSAIPCLVKNGFKLILVKSRFLNFLFATTLLFLVFFKSQAQQNNYYALYAKISYELKRGLNFFCSGKNILNDRYGDFSERMRFYLDYLVG